MTKLWTVMFSLIFFAACNKDTDSGSDDSSSKAPQDEGDKGDEDTADTGDLAVSTVDLNVSMVSSNSSFDAVNESQAQAGDPGKLAISTSSNLNLLASSPTPPFEPSGYPTGDIAAGAPEGFRITIKKIVLDWHGDAGSEPENEGRAVLMGRTRPRDPSAIYQKTKFIFSIPPFASPRTSSWANRDGSMATSLASFPVTTRKPTPMRRPTALWSPIGARSPRGLPSSRTPKAGLFLTSS